ncbi:MAG: hypothetical protein EBS29_08910, partial [Chloroflexia bacterium]|nr:hypothetical protein [Chloroflexia bacterium]
MFNLRHAPTYDCNGHALTASAIATQRQISGAMYDELLAHFKITPSELCRISDNTLKKAQNVINTSRSERQDESLAGKWHELEAWFKGGEGEAITETEQTTDGRGEVADPEYFKRRLQDENGNIPADGWQKAQIHISQMRQALSPRDAGINKLSWTDLGPGNIGGRTRAIVVHPTNANILYTAGVTGGIWKSVNAGASWQPLNDFMANMVVSTMAIDPNNPDILYAGTGEVSQYLQGRGLFKSTDAGATWMQMSTTTDVEAFRFVNKLLAVKNGTDTILYVATWQGIKKSTNSGASWTTTLGTESVMDIEVNPNNSSLLIAGMYCDYYCTAGKAWYSSDAGSTWNEATGLANGSKTVELAYAASSPNIVYASVDNAG